MIPIGRPDFSIRPPWAALLLVSIHGVTLLATWPSERRFQAARQPDAPLVSEARALAALALDDRSTLPNDLRTRLEDLRADAVFPDAEADRILKEIDKTFAFLPTLKRPDWNRRYAAYAEARAAAEAGRAPWSSVVGRHAFRAGDPLWPRLLTHMWVHAGILHFVLMAFFLWLAAAQMAPSWGFLATVLAVHTGGGAAAALAAGAAARGGDWALLGASGAVTALLAGMAARHAGSALRFFYVLGVTYGTFTLPAWTALIGWGAVLYKLDWLTGGRITPEAAAWSAGAAALWGLLAGLLLGWLKKEDTAADSDPRALDLKAENAAKLAQAGRTAGAQAAYEAVLAADPLHVPALQGLVALHELLQREDDAAHTAVRLIRAAIQSGKGQLAEQVFRRWSLKLFQIPLAPQDRLHLGQDLEELQLWREALAYYRSVTEQSKGTSFAGKAIYASGKIFKERMKKPEDAVAFFRQLLDPPYDLEWRAIAEGELRAMGKL